MRPIFPAFTVLLGLLIGPAEAASLSGCVLGNELFRQSRFEAAEIAWQETLAVAPSSACALLGLSRIDQLHFRRRSARDHIAAAYRLAPRDPEVVLAYSEMVSEPNARRILLQNLLVLTGDPSARDRLLLEDRLAGRRPALVSPYTRYSLKLEHFHPLDSTPAGLVLKVSVNGSKPLRLVLDSGADGIVLNACAAGNIDLEPLVEGALGGTGSRESVPAHLMLARSLEIGDFRMENLLIRAAASNLVGGADGIIGTNVFQAFLLRVDAGVRILELMPFPEPAALVGSDPWMAYDAPAAPVRRLGHLLLLPARVDNRAGGYFLLDTGAAFSSVSSGIAGASSPGSVFLRGARGALDGTFRLQPVTFDFAGQKLVDSHPVAFNLEPISRQEGVEISGMIGFSLLGRSVVTINYRDGVVEFNRR